MKNTALCGLFVGMMIGAGMIIGASVDAAAPLALPSEDRIQPHRSHDAGSQSRIRPIPA
jgi:hypothetical protein